MERSILHKKLIAAGRKESLADAVPYGFQERVLARIRACKAVDPWGLWSSALWRAAAPCIAIALVLGAWSYFTPDTANLANDEFAQHFENTVLIAVSDQSL